LRNAKTRPKSEALFEISVASLFKNLFFVASCYVGPVASFAANGIWPFGSGGWTGSGALGGGAGSGGLGGPGDGSVGLGGGIGSPGIGRIGISGGISGVIVLRC
jgi:hypothetical protein